MQKINPHSQGNMSHPPSGVPIVTRANRPMKSAPTRDSNADTSHQGKREIKSWNMTSSVSLQHQPKD